MGRSPTESGARRGARNGIKDSAVDHVAEESGLQRTLIYRYFRDRGILIDRLIDYIVERTELHLFRAISRSRSTGADRFMRLLDYFPGNGYTDAQHLIAQCDSFDRQGEHAHA